MNIEITGASGVGKSSALKYIEGRLKSRYDIVLGGALNESVNQAREKTNKLNLRSLVDKSCLFSDKDFVKKYIKSISGFSAHRTQSLKICQFFERHAEEYFLRLSLNTKHLLIDEGFIHASFPISQFSENFAQDVGLYFSNIPLPGTVIQIHIQPCELLRRIKVRNKPVNSYLYRNDEQMLYHLSRYDWFLCLMEQQLLDRGCRVRHVDASGPIDEWASSLAEIVEEELFLAENSFV